MDIKKPPKSKPHNKTKSFLLKCLAILILIILCFVTNHKLKVNAAKHSYLLSGMNFIYGDFSASEIDYELLNYQTITIDSIQFEISELPVKISVINKNMIIISFADKMGRLYNYRADAFMIFNKLMVLPWFDGMSIDDTYTNKKLYMFDIDYCEGNIQISKNNKSVSLIGKSQLYNYLHLEGTASSKRDTYCDIHAINISYDPFYSNLHECDIVFNDGSKVIDPIIENIDIQHNLIEISWNKVLSICNGDYYQIEKNGSVILNFVDTSPLGFILMDNNKTYAYQKLYENTM